MSRHDATTPLLDRDFRVPDHVVYRSFALETVVVNLERGVYHGLNPTAGRMLETLERSSSGRAAAATLAEELGQPRARVELDLAAFCADLLERGLIEPAR
jgi:Coenzyme PQQ synthesis protein D (PqqD)